MRIRLTSTLKIEDGSRSLFYQHEAEADGDADDVIRFFNKVGKNLELPGITRPLILPGVFDFMKSTKSKHHNQIGFGHEKDESD